jgi:hypothetical protein
MLIENDNTDWYQTRLDCIVGRDICAVIWYKCVVFICSKHSIFVVVVVVIVVIKSTSSNGHNNRYE